MKLIKKMYLRAGVIAATSLPVVVFANASTPESQIVAAKDTVISLVAVAGAAMVAVALAMVGWSVGVKFIKRMKSAA